MPHLFEVLDTFTKFGFCNTFITNVFFIYLTAFHIKKIVGTYKSMVIMFASLGILFSAWELVARPSVHNYNKSFFFFSLNTWLEVPQKYIQIALIIYTGFYITIMAFITVQFSFRYYTLVNPEVANKFNGKGYVAWSLYILFCGCCYGVSCAYFLQPDEFSDDYLEEEVLRVYSMVIRDVPRLQTVVYAHDNSLRWRNFCFLIAGVFIIGSQYLIIIFCGIQMRKYIKSNLNRYSPSHRRLERQFFKALVVQIALPTVLFILPALPVIVLPLLDLEISIQFGVLYALFSVYQPLDSIAFMVIVSEYKRALKNVYRLVTNRNEEPTCSQDQGMSLSKI